MYVFPVSLLFPHPGRDAVSGSFFVQCYRLLWFRAVTQGSIWLCQICQICHPRVRPAPVCRQSCCAFVTMGGEPANRVISTYTRTRVILSSVGFRQGLCKRGSGVSSFLRSVSNFPRNVLLPTFHIRRSSKPLHVRPRICLALSLELLSICLHRSSFDTGHVGDNLGCDPN